jgi:hypothetical protein
MTGWAQGLCRQAGNGARRFQGAAMGKGQGRGRGLKCGMRNRYGQKAMAGSNYLRPVDEE